MRSKKAIWITAVTVVVAAAAAAAIYHFWPKPEPAPIIVPNLITVQKDTISVQIKGSGATKATEQTIVYAADQGNVNQVLGKLNMDVKKGQVLMTYKGTDVSKDMRQRTTTLQQQQSDLHDKQEQYKQLVMDGTSQTDIDSARLGIEKAKTDIASTESEIAQLQKDQIPHNPLVAPVSGTITKVSIVPGGAVSNGAEVFTIVDYHDLSATIQVDEMNIPKIHTGMKASVQLDALPDQTYTGRVSAIANEGSIKNGVSTFAVTIHLDRAPNAKAGMSAQATIFVEEKKNIPVLPLETVNQRDGKYFVQLQGKPDPQAPAGTSPAPVEKEVKVGIHNESLIEIKSGLKEGDQVIGPEADMFGDTGLSMDSSDAAMDTSSADTGTASDTDSFTSTDSSSPTDSSTADSTSSTDSSTSTDSTDSTNSNTSTDSTSSADNSTSTDSTSTTSSTSNDSTSSTGGSSQ
ncbi:efflux RND transporter periplasmic adaptor subunit [Paenibacillus dauci]|uniref:efflux RND transporter periplasmic adaptor subunit n=1 Tax=Paenibacillus dauci TaxID=1567106 RepID=UPI00069792A6|nr:efflux RND transporter periplasmic adaptor subunit [Paenibacillus dauci]